MGVKLPSDADLGGLPSLHSGRPIANIDTTGVAEGGQALARGVTALGVGIEQHEEGRSRFEIARAKADFLSAKIGLDEQYKEDQKWDDLPKRYGKDLNAAREAAINSISNPQAREQFRFTISPTFTQGVMGAEGLARTRQRDHFEADTFTRLNTLRDSALKSTDPDERTAAIQTGQEMIDGLVEGGVIDRAEGAKRKRAWAVDYAVAEVSSRPWGEQIEILRPAPQGEEGYYTRLAQVESGGNPNARATTSSAEGLYQFTRNTWLDTIRRHRPDLKEGRTDADLLALRRDPTVSREMVGYLTADNSKALSAAGVAVDPGSQYLAHFLGAGDAIKVLKAAPGTPVADIIGRDKIEANRSILEGKTAGTVASWAAKKMGSGGGVADFIPADKREELLRSAETKLSAEALDQERALRLQEKQEKIVSDNEEIEIAKMLADPARRESVTAMSIASNPKLTREAIQRNIALIDKADRTDNTYGPEFYSVFQRVHLPEGDPNRVQSINDLVPMVGKGLTMSGYNEVVKHLQGKGTPEGDSEAKMLSQFLRVAHDTLSGTNPMIDIKDPKGEEINLGFMAQVLPQYYKLRSQGKTPAQLLDPNSPDYLGKSMNSLKRSTAEMVRDMIGDAGGADADTSTSQGLIKAVQSGKISRAEGEKIALERGWIKPSAPAVAPPVSR